DEDDVLGARGREYRRVLPEPPDGAVDAEEELPDELRDRQKTLHRAVDVPPAEDRSCPRNDDERPSDESEPRHLSWDQPGSVHDVTEDQPVPPADDPVGAELERPILERRERDGEVGCVWRVLPQADDAEHEDDPGRDERGLHDASGDITDGE